MTPLSSLSQAALVPYRHRVSAVAAVVPATLDLNRPAPPFHQADGGDRASSSKSYNTYSANSAAPGFAAHILVEAGLTGSDPFAGARAARAYYARPAFNQTIRLVA
jgi:hypothetical protein